MVLYKADYLKEEIRVKHIIFPHGVFKVHIGNYTVTKSEMWRSVLKLV